MHAVSIVDPNHLAKTNLQQKFLSCLLELSITR